MVDLSRRLFLNGAIALIGAKTFTPSVSAMSNLPKIYGDGQHNDSYGFQALFNNEPCIFNRGNIGIEENKGVIIYRGFYKIDKTIIIPSGANVSIERMVGSSGVEFVGIELDDDAPFFNKKSGANVKLNNGVILFEARENGNNKLIAQDKWSRDDELEYNGLDSKKNYQIASEKEIELLSSNSKAALINRIEEVG